MKKIIKVFLPVAALLIVLGFGVRVSAVEACEVPIAPIYTEQVNPVYQQICGEYYRDIPVYNAEPVTYYSDIETAAEKLREKMEDRETAIVIGLTTTDNPNTVPLHKMIADAALEHTGKGTQGDYLLWQYKRYQSKLSGSYNSQTGIYTLVLTYTVEYYTSAEQEEELSRQVRILLDQLDVYDENAYTKVCAIYDYMCENIVYDYAGLEEQSSDLIFTAYAALLNKKAVCQGYSNLFYRLALELGVDCRIITGIGNGGPHAWNIVKLNGKYYNLDATWDATRKQFNQKYQYFLRCDSDFGDHQRDEDYITADFYKAYPMGVGNYSNNELVFTPGEFDGKDGVTDGDAVYLLRHSLFPDAFVVDPGINTDINCDGVFTDADAVYLLRFTLFPDAFPLYPEK